MPAVRKDYKGWESEYIKVLHYAYLGSDHHHRWMCECKACGKKWPVRGTALQLRKSCGCRKHMRVSSREMTEAKFRFGVITRRWVSR